MKYWAVSYDTAIKHHGIEGQKWGVQNGPPYPLNRNKNGSISKEQREKKSKYSDKKLNDIRIENHKEDNNENKYGSYKRKDSSGRSYKYSSSGDMKYDWLHQEAIDKYFGRLREETANKINDYWNRYHQAVDLEFMDWSDKELAKKLDEEVDDIKRFKELYEKETDQNVKYLMGMDLEYEELCHLAGKEEFFERQFNRWLKLR